MRKPEQNIAFNDHYLEVDYDLSDVMFVATSNSMNIPAPLLDRMEVIRLSGYTEDEKLNIAKRHLLPKQIERNALKKTELHIDDSAILGTSARTGLPVSAETSAVHIAVPALGPSFGVAPSGTWT